METFNKVIDLLYLAKQDGVEVLLNEDRLQIKVAENKVINQDLLKEIRSNKQILIDYLSDNDRKVKSTDKNNKIPRFNRDALLHIPASFSQERLWFIDSMGDSEAYHLPTILRLEGPLDTEALSRSFQHIIERHEALRTTFYEQEGQVYQSFKESSLWQLQLVDGASYRKDIAALKTYIETLVSAPFNLADDYPVRASLIQLAEDVRVLVVTIHHIASDAWSVSVMVQELVELYDAFVQGSKPRLLPLPLQYADYAVWQRNYLQGTVLENKVSYWKEKLGGATALQLPTDYQRPVVQNTIGDRFDFRIGKVESDQLQSFCRQQGVTLFMALLSVYKVLLYRYSGQSDICVGTSLASRQQQELEGLIGFFVNTLALRDKVNPNASFITLLQQVRTTTLEAYEHQDVPFEKVVEAVVKERDPSRSPLFQVMLVLANTPAAAELRLGEVVLSEETYDQEIAKFDFTCFINEESDGLSGSIQYAAGLYSTATIQRMSDQFLALIDSAVKNPEQSISLLPMLSSKEENQLLQDFNNCQVAYPAAKSIVDLFEEQVENKPQHTALVFEDETFTYAQLNERSNQLAHYLKSKGVQSGDLVPLYMDRSADMMIGMMGILKAGAAYVPVDTQLPADRIRYLLEDTRATVIVCNAESSTQLEPETGVNIIEINQAANYPTADPTVKPSATDLAYVIYTSGSTGQPKGVMIEHRSLVDYYYGLDQQVHVSQCQSFALVSTIATDLGNTVIFGSLLSGGALHVFSKESVSNIEYLHRYFQQHAIDCLKIVPSHWKALSTEEALLLPKQLLVFGGEALPTEVVTSIQQSGSTCKIVNHYGPTETTIGKLLHQVDAERQYGSTIPIGKPFSNTAVYVLSKELQLCPVGVAGQLYIAGDGLARGYLNNEELTQKKFVANPFTKVPQFPTVTNNNKENNESLNRMYATGDQVKWSADGNIQFIGRVDDQVKIRGYRVEPGEITSVLLQHEEVKTGVVLTGQDKQGNNRLVAYIVPQYPFNRESIQAYLKEQLPDYMIPSMLIEIEEMPLTANGKIDRKALPDPDTEEAAANRYTAPRNEAEEKMAAIWADVLEVEQVGVDDDFFVLGGHSLLAIRLVSLIRKAFGVEVPIGDIFDYPTVALLATRLTHSADSPVLLSIEKVIPRPAHIPLSFSQERLWFIDQLGGSTHYHIPSIVQLHGILDTTALAAALQHIINRHEVLRTVIREEDGIPYQLIQSAESWQLQLVDGSLYNDNDDDNEKGTAIAQYLQQFTNAPFDLTADFPVRAALISLSGQEHVLAVTLHHIASDGYSTAIMVRELSELYSAAVEGRAASLLPLPVQYADYAMWQRRYLQGEVWENKLQYWKDTLQGIETPQLLTDYPRPLVQSTRGAVVNHSIDKPLADQLQALSQQQGATLYMTLLAAFHVLLHRYSGQSDICIGTPVAGRQQQELEGLIGFFINTLALRNKVNSTASFTELLQQVRTTTLAAYEQQDVPFEKVVEALVKERDMSRSPLFQVLLTLQNNPDSGALTLGEVALSDVATQWPDYNGSAKFDLTFNITETPTGLNLSVEYSTDLYKQETVERMAAHFAMLLQSAAANPEQSVGLLPMLSQAEEQQLLLAFNDTTAAYPTDKNIVDLFEHQAASVPANTALMMETQRLTYAELNARANQLARYLVSKGVGAETLVPVCIERSVEMVVAILGVLKAGAAYVPVDPHYPEERIQFMIKDVAAHTIITSKDSSHVLPVVSATAVIEINGEAQAIISQQPVHDLHIPVKQEQLAYIIYTSGSTGLPKGVMIEHGSVINYLLNNKTKYISANSSNTGSFIHLSYTFDASITALFMPLLAGRPIVIASTQLMNVFEDPNLLKYAPYDFIKITPSHLELLGHTINPQNKNWIADKLVIGGEALHLGHLNAFISKVIDVEVINEYGPTESTVGCSTYSFYTAAENKEITNGIPIGKPIDNIKLYLIGENDKLVPIGVVGEICIAGAGLARGYWKRAELTAEKFIPDLFSNVAGAKMYRTGDLGRWLADGNMEYLGRKDEQVKVNGYRIELGEIETVVRQSGMVSNAVVAVKESVGNVNQLIAYVVPNMMFDQDSIINYLKTKLPAYMVPQLWVEIEEVPLTANGKIDRRALSEPDVSASTVSYVAPTNAQEAKLAEVWQDLLEEDEIGIHDNFFKLGGHSLLAIRLVSLIRKAFGVEVPIGDIFDYPTVALLATRLTHSADSPVLLSIEKVIPRPAHIPLSFSQERLWFIDQLGGSTHYHIPSIVQLHGILDTTALAAALQHIINRHEVLRTVIREEDGIPYQLIQSAESWQLQLVDGSLYNDNDDDNEKGTAIAQYLQQFTNAPFDLTADFPVRAALISLSGQEHVLAVTLHHIASDGYSTAIMVRELSELYSAAVEGRAASLLPLPVQYADYAMWQRRYLQGEVWENKLQYWKDTLQGIETPQLLTDYPRPLVQSTRGAVVNHSIDKPLADQLQALSQQQGATLYMTLLAAFHVLLHRYSGQSDICIGTPVAGRQQQELEGLIGFFINTLALRNKVNSTASFTELLQQVRTTTLAAYEQQDVPFEKVVEALVKERDMSRSPLFQVLLTLQNNPDSGALTLGEVALSDVATQWPDYNGSAKFDLTFNITETPTGLNLSVEYSTDLYKQETVERMAAHFAMLLQSAAANPEQSVGLLPMLSQAEEQQLLLAFNDTTAAYPTDKNIVDLFEHQAASVPANTALMMETQRLTYAELNARANQLARYLVSKGVGAETLVPVCIERSVEMVVAILGVLKAGAAYVPVDPQYPEERIRFMIEDTKAVTIVTSEYGASKIPAGPGLEFILIDKDWENIAAQPSDNLQIVINPNQLAYIIYTSGSTGTPKGAMIEHSSVVRLFQTDSPLFDFNESDVWAMFHSYCFDFSVWEMYGALFYGGRLVIVPDHTIKDAQLFSSLILSEKITVLNQTPAAFYVLQDILIDKTDQVPVRFVIFGGEALNPMRLRSWKQAFPATRLINMYGITETTVHVTFQEIEWANINAGTSIIGKPIPTLNCYILDSNQHLVPVGVTGEIHVAGAGLARGYLNLPALTAEKFVHNPFSQVAGSRMYRSGDVGRWLSDGSIEYMGRQDEQVKIRGYRIELGEIEAAVQQSGLVHNAVIVAKEDKEASKYLVGYIVPKENFLKESLQDYLKSRLPDYMVPQLWVQLENLPLTGNGKVDRKALPDADVSQIGASRYVAPETVQEKMLVQIWEDLLGVEQIGIYDNFFELGGHSLLAMRLVSTVRKTLKTELSIKDLFIYPTISYLAIHLHTQEGGILLPAIEAVIPRPELIPLSFSQERLWFIDQLEGSTHYHVPAVLRLTGKLDAEVLKNAFQQIVLRHEVLRTVIIEDDGRPYQTIKGVYNWQLQTVKQEAFINDEAGLQEYIAHFINAPFNLAKDFPVRAALIYLDEQEYILVVTLHHIASDAWSDAIMIGELKELYNAHVEHRSAELPLLPIQYADYAIWQRNYLNSEAWDKKIEYWRGKLQGTTALQLLTDYSRPLVQSTNGALVRLAISKELTDGLYSLSQQQGATLFMTLLTALKVLLYRYTSQADICVGTPVAGRGQAETERLIGFFVNTLALRDEVSGSATFEELLQQVRNTALEAYEYADVPFEQVVDAVIKERNLNRSPLFQVMLVLQNVPDAGGVNLGEVQASVYQDGGIGHTTAKFDLTFSITERKTESEQGLHLSIEYNTDLYNAATIERMAAHYTALLVSAVKEPQQQVEKLPLLSNAEKDKLLTTFNATETDYPADKTIVDLFEDQTVKTPEKVAILFEEQQLSYRQLNEKSNQLAHYLKNKGVQKGSLIPICLDRSLEMLIGIIGIIKTGAAYMPIDPDYPIERINHMLQDAVQTIVISNQRSKRNLPLNNDVIDINDCTLIGQEQTCNLKIDIQPVSLAYIMYTSGSTGRPKGVQVQHRNVVSLVRGVDYVNFNDQDVLLTTGSPSFDATTFEYWGMLLNGGQLVLCSENTLLDNLLLKEALHNRKVTKMWFTSSWFNQLVETDIKLFEPLKTVLVGGEKLSEYHIEKIRNAYSHIELINGYGPTENTTFSLTYPITETKISRSIPIGHPLNNRNVFILDKHLQLVPVGISGEICVGGAGLSSGYLNLPELTAEKFVQHPFNNSPDSKIYRTGDTGRWLPDGNIEYLGRVDDQVKIRGYRIELGEIESVLQQSGLVKGSVVVAKENPQGTKQLVGYVIPGDNYTKEEIESYIKTRLPEYMIPQFWVKMDELPLTSNGKINKASLPAVNEYEISTNAYVAPRNKPEQNLADIWKQLLSIERIGIHDNFFELGGDSIITIQVVSRMRRLGYELHPKDLFIHQTIARLSAVIAERSGLSATGEQGLLTGFSGLLPIQQWYLQNGGTAISHFNQSVLLSIDKTFNESMLQQVFSKIMLHHDALRFKYIRTDEGWEQEYSSTDCNVLSENFSSVEEGLLKDFINESADRHQRQLDIEKGELIRVVLMETPATENDNRLLLVVHHLAIDGVSWRILLEDLDMLLTAINSGGTVNLGTKSSSYRQWYQALEQYGQSRALLSQKAYWQNTIKNYEPLWVEKKVSGKVKGADINHYSISLDAEQTRQLLQQVPQAYHTEINDLLLCALAYTLCEWVGKDKIVIGMEGHGREDIGNSVDTSRTVGWFTSLYPLLLETAFAKGTDQQIKSIKEQLRQVPGRGLGYGVLKYINQEAALQVDTAWDIVFNYLGQFDNVVKESKWLKGAGDEESAGNAISDSYKKNENLLVTSFVQSGELTVNWSYSSLHFEAATMMKLAASYKLRLQQLINHCLQQTTPVFTPSDYGLGTEVHYAELDRFLDEPFKGDKRRNKIDSICRLSGLQQGMLFHGLYDNEAWAYTEQFGCDLIHAEVAILMKSWQHVLRNHSILRSGFYYDVFSVPVQCVYRQIDLPVEVMDYSNLSSDEQVLAVKAYEEADRRKGFDFESAPLMRIGLLQLSNKRYRMLWTFHHILFDGWSLPLVMEEFLQTYESLARNKVITEPKEDKYEDYIHYIERSDKEAAENYWRQYLDQVTLSTLLPFIDATSLRTKGAGTYQTLPLKFDTTLTKKIQEYAQKQRLTVSTLMQGAWSLLLHQYTGNKEVLFGMIVSGRPDDMPDIENRVGMYINTLPMHSSLQPGQKIIEWLQDMQSRQVASLPYQYTPLQTIQSWSGISGDLFDSILVFENYPVSKIIGSGKWLLGIENVQMQEQTNYPLTIIVNSSETINVGFSFNTSLLEEGYVRQIRNHFAQVLEGFIANENALSGEIEILTAAEKKQLLVDYTDTSAAYPLDTTIVDLLQQQAAKTPDNLALAGDGAQLSYQQLNERSNQLAHYLVSKGVTVETLVPVCMQRSVELVVTMLAILKAGGAYVPIDPEYPAERISFMLQDVNASWLVTSENIAEQLPLLANIELIIPEQTASIAEQPVHDLPIQVQANHLAYVIYTSGSTGKPKGVMIEHKNLANLIGWHIQEYKVTQAAKATVMAGVGFDAFGWEVWPYLSCGASLYIVDDVTRLTPAMLTQSIHSNAITHCFIATALVPDFVAETKNKNLGLRYLLTGGDKLPPVSTSGLSYKIINNYGPTENTVVASNYELSANDKYIVPPIGKPISNTAIYLLDIQMQLVPPGVPGELCIGGASLARGYWNRSTLTAEKFIANPFDNSPDARLYKSGDLCRWLPDGNLEYMGRIDDQVKIRGYRIELGEIENVLQQSEWVNNAAVLAKEDTEGNKYLVAYIVPKTAFNKVELIAYLKARLPEYMVPQLWVELESLPLTANGKLNRKALPDPDATESLSNQYVEPRTELEAELVRIWKEVLSVKRVGVQDNFFDLGGHSLLVMRLISAIKNELKIDLAIKTIFELRTVEDLANYIQLTQNNNQNKFEEYDTITL